MTAILGGVEWLAEMAGYQIEVILAEYIIADFAHISGETVDNYFQVADDDDDCPKTEVYDLETVEDTIKQLQAKTERDALDEMVFKFFSKIVELVGGRGLTPAIVREAAEAVGMLE